MPLDDTSFLLTTQKTTSDEDIDPTTALLIRARGFLERGWCRGTAALNANNRMVHPKSERAVGWCMYGSLIAAGMGMFGHRPAIDRLRAAIGSQHICKFNNTQETVEPVLAAFDRTIAAGEPR